MHATTPSLLPAVASLSIAACAMAQLPVYSVEELGASLQGFGMNELGDVVGRKVLDGNHGLAFFARRGGEVELLPIPPEWIGSDAYAISNKGVIVGAVSANGIASIGSHACAWWPTNDGYRFQFLGAMPGHDFSTALGVNDLGDIVGGSGGIGLGLYPNAALFAADDVVELPGISLAADVNNERQVIAGNMLLDLDTMTTETIPLPAGNWQGMVSSDLNDAGGFCGYVAGFSGCSTFPVLYMPESGWEFVGGCASTTSAVSLNELGDTLTFVYQGGLGIVFHDSGYHDIGSLIAPGEGNWLITGVSTINSKRQILCAGKNLPGSITSLLRLTPMLVGDLDGDGHVDGSDLGALLGEWGPCAGCASDFGGDGVVDGDDLGVLLGGWTG